MGGRSAHSTWIPADVVAGHGDANGHTNPSGGSIGSGDRDRPHLGIDVARAAGLERYRADPSACAAAAQLTAFGRCRGVGEDHVGGNGRTASNRDSIGLTPCH